MNNDEIQSLLQQLSVSGSYQSPKLADELLAKIRELKRANQTPEPTPMAVTPPAAQEPRQP